MPEEKPASLRARRAFWRTAGGPILTLAAALLIETLARTPLPLSPPAPILLLTVVYAAYLGGLRAGLASTAIAGFYSAYASTAPGQPLRSAGDPIEYVLGIAVAAVGLTLLVDRLRARIERQLHQERATRLSIEQTHARLTLVLETNPDGILLLGMDRRIWFANTAATTLLGRPRPEILGQHYQEAMGEVRTPDGRRLSGDELPIEHVLKTGEPVRDVELALVRPDGHRVFVAMNATPLRQPNGALEGVVAALHDITRQKRAEAALRHSRERYQMLVEAAPVGIGLLSGEVFVYANPAGARLLGASSPAEIVGRRLTDFVHPAYLPLVRERLRQGIVERRPLEPIEEKVIRLDGTVIDVEVRSLPVTYRGRPALQVLAQDITERKRREQALREGEERLRLALEAGHMGTWEWRIRESRLEWSPDLEALHGFAPGEFDGRPETLRRTIHPEDRDRVWAALRRVLDEQRSALHIEYRVVYRDGSVHWLEGRGRLLLDAEGKPDRLIGVCADVTPHKRAETSLRESDEKHRYLAEASRVLTSSLDRQVTLQNLARLAVSRIADLCVVDVFDDGRIVRVATAYRDPAQRNLADALKRYAPRPATDRGVSIVLRTGRAVLIPDASREAMEPPQDAEHSRILRLLRPKSIMYVPLVARGHVLGAVSFLSMTSERRFGPEDLQLAEELAGRAALAIDNARLYQDAERAVRARDEVLSVVSHDLRNPLNAIAMSADLLSELPLPEEQRRKHLEVIRRSCNQMDRLIRDLLDVTKIEAGQLSIQREALEVASLLDEVREMFLSKAREKELRFEIEVAEGLAPIHGDRQRILQVLGNLVGNAVKFTPERGRVVVQATAAGREVVFSVQDTGPGIAPEDLPRVFQRFWQATDAKGVGAGLGLSIAKGIVEAHGGRIWVESKRGVGSAFFFTIPTVEAAEEKTDATREQGDGAR
jgi:PAS domain S-box-containing protein